MRERARAAQRSAAQRSAHLARSKRRRSFLLLWLAARARPETSPAPIRMLALLRGLVVLVELLLQDDLLLSRRRSLHFFRQISSRVSAPLSPTTAASLAHALRLHPLCKWLHDDGSTIRPTVGWLPAAAARCARLRCCGAAGLLWALKPNYGDASQERTACMLQYECTDCMCVCCFVCAPTRWLKAVTTAAPFLHRASDRLHAAPHSRPEKHEAGLLAKTTDDT